jgi:transcriptional regulator GlxA family with amidase domain
MIKIAVLVYEEVVPTSVSGVIDLVTGTNRYLRYAGLPAVFELELIGSAANKISAAFSVNVKCLNSCSDALVPDLVIIPAFNGDSVSVLDNYREYVHWIKDMHETGSGIASLCVGCYFLAESGLLNGKEATSHWIAMDDLKLRYPMIFFKPDVFITDHDGIYTSGGGISSLKLILYLIEKFCGRETALAISKLYTVEMDTSRHSDFAVFTGQHQHSDREILTAQRYIEQHYRQELSIDAIAAFVNMGRRNFIRRFKAATGNNPYEYIQRVRIESAKKAIELNEKDIAAIMYDTGYNDLQTFREIFKRITGHLPQAYRKKYARNALNKPV